MIVQTHKINSATYPNAKNVICSHKSKSNIKIIFFWDLFNGFS